MLNEEKRQDHRPATRPLSTMLMTALVFSSLAACQPDEPPALSLEEAKRATANFEGQAFVPPPRRINDITDTLGKARREFVYRVKTWRTQATREPPASLNKAEKGRFYVRRALAKGRLGDVPGLLADMEVAAQSDPTFTLAKAQWQLRHGFYSAGFESLEKLATAGSGNRLREYQQHRVRVKLAVEYAEHLELEKAENLLSATMAKREAIFDRCRRGVERGSSRAKVCLAWVSYFKMQFQYARAKILDPQGDLTKAERLYRSAFDLAFRFETWPPPMQNLPRGKGDYVHLPRLAGAWLQSISLSLADNLRRQGRLSEAEVWARKALRNVPSGTLFAADVLRRLTRIIYDQGRFNDAQTLAEAGIEMYEAASIPPHSVSVARSYSQRADALVALEKWREALAQYEAIRERMSADAWAFRSLLAGNLNWAVALVKTGNPDEALKLLHPIFAGRRAALGSNHYETAEVNGFIGMAKAGKGDVSGAISIFREVMPALLAAASGESRESLRPGTAQERRLRLILEAYLDVLTIVYRVEPDKTRPKYVAEMFRIAGILRSHSVQRALSSSAARSAIHDPELATLARQEQDTAWKLESLGRLAANLSSRSSLFSREDTRVASLQSQISDLRIARRVILDEIKRRFPDYAALSNPQPATLSGTRAVLRADESLIATYLGAKRSYVWAVQKNKPAVFAEVNLNRVRAATVVRDLRRSLDPQVATLGKIPPFDVKLSHRLYGILLAPVESGWRDAKNLLIVAHAELGQLPFSVLVTNPTRLPEGGKPLFSNYRAVPWLARTHSVTVLPSVSSLALLRNLPPATPERRNFAGFGDPFFSNAQAVAAAALSKETQVAALTSRRVIAVRGLPIYMRSAPSLGGVTSADLAVLPRLPDTADELKSIALAMNADLSRDVFIGKAASEGQVKSIKLSRYRVLAFATHGLVPGDLDGLSQPALALSSPSVVGGKDDGLLTMGEILGLKLDADWVVLSACNTASSKGAGAEAVSGLGRAFFYAGTRALLVSNWPVETTSAKTLTTDLFRRQAKDSSLSRAEALQQTLLGLIDNGGLKDAEGRTVFSYAHPIFWAPFSLVGDGGGGKPAG